MPPRKMNSYQRRRANARSSLIRAGASAQPATTNPLLHDRQMRALFEGAIDAMVIADDAGRYVDANTAACDLFGLPKAELLGRCIADFAEPDFDFAQAWQAFRQAERVTVEFRLVRADGTIREVECAATANFVPHRHLSILRDVSDRKRMERELHQLNRQLEQRVEQRTVELQQVHQHLTFHIENSPLAFIGWDHHFRVKLWSKQAEQIFGWQAEEVLGRAWNEFAIVHEADVSEVEQVIMRLLQGGQTIHTNRNYRKDQTILYCEWYCSAQLDAAGTVISVLSLVQDVTARAQLEADRHRAEIELRQQAEREHLLANVTQRIRQSLDLGDILTTTVAEVRQLLQVDRVVIYRFEPDFSGTVTVESVAPGWVSLINQTIVDTCFADEYIPRYTTGMITAKADIYLGAVNSCYVNLMEQFQTRAVLVVPILPENTLWGLLIAHQCDAPRHWQPWETTLMRKLAGQVSIAIQHSELHRQVHRLNAGLEREVKKRTVQLKLAYEFESTLKRITDKVRDSLDEDQILQGAVEELGRGLGVISCNAALFDLTAGTSTVRYEYTTLPFSFRGRVSRLADFPEIYEPLLQGQHFQFCSLLPNPERGRVAMFCCPIWDDQGILGDLWLVNQSYYAFGEQDIRLVQQVANHCAIALRQSHLYQESQAQVHELERLNQLKDDFLSTVSHELRTPISSIKMATQMLDLLLFQHLEIIETATPDSITNVSHRKQPDPSGGTSAFPVPPALIAPTTWQQAKRYFDILKDECQREIALINDLLDLTRLDAAIDPILPTTINLQIWLPHILESFKERTSQQQQQLELRVSHHTPPIITDLSYLQRILIELLNNACKYTPAGGMIQVSVHIVGTDGVPPIDRPESGRSRGTWATQVKLPLPVMSLLTPNIAIWVTNTGTEIPPLECQRIFDKFYRIPNNDPWKHGGTGLGLALVKRLTHRIGGNIRVESANYETSFIVELPIR